MKSLYLLILSLLMCHKIVLATELARPQGIGGDYLLELNLGIVKEDSHQVYEVGFEFERFIDRLEHHCAVGLSFEASSVDGDFKYFIGGLTSLYYHHFKVFFTSGILLGSNSFREWKTRFGLGREFFMQKEYIIIPAFTVDRLEGESYPGFNIGFAKEF